MSTGFTEDEMRRALGLDTPTPAPVKAAHRAPVKRRGPVLRVTMNVSKEYDGEVTQFIHDSKSLSRFDAEQEAKKALAKAKFKYYELASIVKVD